MPERLGPNLVSWASLLEDEAREQALRTSRLPFIAGAVALMPDAHFGLGATVGSVIATQGAIIPAAVGVDIGCGMAAVKTDLFASGLPDNGDKLLSWIAMVVPAGVGKGHDKRDMVLEVPSHFSQKQESSARSQLGSLGSGNHFVEICLDENDQVWVLLHSGSRGVGNQTAQKHIATARGLMKQWWIELEDPDLAYLVQDTPEFDAYISDMLWCQEYARRNREIMLDAILTQVWAWAGVGEHEGVGHEIQRINCHHNYTQREKQRGMNVWLTRKGAISAKYGELGLIPGSMGASSYVVEGLGNAGSWYSCSHGAGRRMSRTKARKEITPEQLTEQMGDRVWLRGDAKTLVDESPLAYKDIDVVMEDQKDLVKIVHRLRQIINYKGL